MADHHQSSGGAGVLVASSLLSLALAAGLIYFFSSSAEPLTEVDREWFLQPEVTIDEAALQESRREHYDSPLEEKPAYEEYREAFRAANMLQFTDPTPKELEEMSKLLALRADDAITEVRGAHNFILIGEPIFEECSKALDGLLTDIIEGRVSMEDARTGALSDAHDIYKRNCGHAIPQLLESRLITEDGEWVRPQYGPVVFDILQRYRFAAQISLRVHYTDSLSPADYRELTRWRLLVPEAFSPAERVQNLSRARKKPPTGLNIDRAQAFVMASGGYWKSAREAYQRVCDSPDATSQDYVACDWLRSEYGDEEDEPASEDGAAPSPADLAGEK